MKKMNLLLDEQTILEQVSNQSGGLAGFCNLLLTRLSELRENYKLSNAVEWERKANEYFNKGLKVEAERDSFEAECEALRNAIEWSFGGTKDYHEALSKAEVIRKARREQEK